MSELCNYCGELQCKPNVTVSFSWDNEYSMEAPNMHAHTVARVPASTGSMYQLPLSYPRPRRRGGVAMADGRCFRWNCAQPALCATRTFLRVVRGPSCLVVASCTVEMTDARDIFDRLRLPVHRSAPSRDEPAIRCTRNRTYAKNWRKK